MFTFSWNLSHFLFQSGHVANWQSDYLQVKFSEFLSNLILDRGLVLRCTLRRSRPPSWGWHLHKLLSEFRNSIPRWFSKLFCKTQRNIIENFMTSKCSLKTNCSFIFLEITLLKRNAAVKPNWIFIFYFRICFVKLKLLLLAIEVCWLKFKSLRSE